MLNKILKALIMCDFFVFTGFGLITPIFAIFITDQIKGGTITSVGIAIGIYLLIKAVLQIPVAKIADKEQGNIMELFVLTLGYTIVALVPFAYIFAKTIWHIYLIQAFLGIGTGLGYPGWSALFTKFINKGREAASWSVYSTWTVLGAGGAAAVGGVVAQYLGFKLLFFLVGVFSILSCVVVYSLYRHIKKFE
jgi:MFS family permease